MRASNQITYLPPTREHSAVCVRDDGANEIRQHPARPLQQSIRHHTHTIRRVLWYIRASANDATMVESHGECGRMLCGYFVHWANVGHLVAYWFSYKCRMLKCSHTRECQFSPQFAVALHDPVSAHSPPTRSSLTQSLTHSQAICRLSHSCCTLPSVRQYVYTNTHTHIQVRNSQTTNSERMQRFRNTLE